MILIGIVLQLLAVITFAGSFASPPTNPKHNAFKLGAIYVQLSAIGFYLMAIAI